jgi:TRAP-type C4-dicarboxylate transport system permease small subunit
VKTVFTVRFHGDFKEERLRLKKREENAIWRAIVSIQRVAIIIAGSGTTLIVAGACILRWFSINFIGFEEILIMVAFWLYMVGCAYGSYEKSQITADILAVMMKEGILKDILTLLRGVITLVLCAIMLVWAFSLVQWAFTMNTRTPVFRIPMTLGYCSMLFGLGMSSVYNIFYLYDTVRDLLRKYAGKRMPEEKEASA